MQDRIQKKIVRWYVFQSLDGTWGYSNIHPGEKNSHVEGPMEFSKARALVYVKNKEVET